MSRIKVVLLSAITFSSLWFLYTRSQKEVSNTAGDQGSALSLAWENFPRSFDPRYVVDAEGQWLETLLHCSLINFDKTGSVIGDLAESWEWRDSKTLSMSIRTNAKFGDGSPVTTNDIKSVFDFFLNKEHKIPSPRAGAFLLLSRVESEGTNIVFHLKEPDSTFISNLAIGIVPGRFITEDLISAKNPVKGCGPYIMTDTNLTELTLKSNPHYTLGDKPRSNTVKIKIVKDESTRFAKLRSGEIDIAQNNISREKAYSIESDFPDLKIQRTPGLRTTYLGFNFKDKIVGRLEVRKAINLAIDREKIITYLLKGMAIPASTMLPPRNYFFNNKISKATFDPGQAESILEEGGFKKDENGIRFSLTYKTSLDQTRIGIAKSIASDLKKIGIHVKVQPLEWGKFKEDVDKGNVQIWSLAWIGFKDPDIYRYAFATESFPPNGGNRGRFSSPELDQILGTARKTTEKEERKKLYLKAQQIVSDQVPYAFLFHEENYAIMQKNIQGFEIYADGRFSSLSKVFRVTR